MKLRIININETKIKSINFICVPTLCMVSCGGNQEVLVSDGVEK